MEFIQQEPIWVTMHQDPSPVVDKLEEMVNKSSNSDARLQYFVKESFFFTQFHNEIAEKYSIKVHHHIHDRVLYRILIEDIYVCTFVLLSIFQITNFVVLDEWVVLANEIYFIYAPFIKCYVPDRNTGVSMILSLLKEAQGMCICIMIKSFMR